MSGRSASSNNSDTNAELDGLRRGRPDGAANPMGYESEDGGTKDVTGDDDAPFFKAPPFPEAPVPWFGPEVLVAQATYVQTTEVDVSDWRLLQVLLELRWTNAGVATAQLGLLAEHLAASLLDPPEDWYVTAVVDPTVAYVTQPGFGDGFGSRMFAPSQLRSPIFNTAGTRTVKFCLQFDVANASKFRLSVGQLVANQTCEVAMSYQRSN